MEQVFLLRAFTLALQPMLMTSLSQTRSATESQAATLVNFTTNNDLKINASKTEVCCSFNDQRLSDPNLTFSVAGHQVGTKQEAKCLGYLWKSNLGSAKSVEANIEKGMKAFFAAGAIGAYQGSLNPSSQFDILIQHLCSPNPSLWV